MAFEIPGFNRIFPVTQVNPEASRGVRSTNSNFFVTGVGGVTTGYDPYMQYDNKLENGHGGAAQRMSQAGYDGYSNPRWIA